MGDACERCGGTGKIGSKESSGNGVSRRCWECAGTGMTRPGPRPPRPK